MSYLVVNLDKTPPAAPSRWATLLEARACVALLQSSWLIFECRESGGWLVEKSLGADLCIKYAGDNIGKAKEIATSTEGVLLNLITGVFHGT
jgi:hypothetical protein